MRPWASLLLLLLVACDEEEATNDTATALDECSPLTWENFGEGYLRSWCTGCHHTELTGDARQGAPAGVDFDDREAVLRQGERIIARASGEAPTMPPVGGSTDAERERLALWLRCEMGQAPP